MEKKIFRNIDEYIQSQPEPQALRLQELRELVRKTAPGAEETISYNMPAFRLAGRILLYIAAFRNHVSFFPGNSRLIKTMEKELVGFDTTKGTIHFDLDKPIPAELVEKIVMVRVRENEEKATSKKIKR